MQRKRAVVKLGNPALRKIEFYTFRYWRVTYEYVCKEAFTWQQVMQYIEQVFDYVRTNKDGVSLYRNLKYKISV